ncbi:MAG: DUF1521 domain-containing protein [Aquisalinus sp.]|nr:DUF1521 domain-containing protein [Aquisalinus sp.]
MTFNVNMFAKVAGMLSQSSSPLGYLNFGLSAFREVRMTLGFIMNSFTGYPQGQGQSYRHGCGMMHRYRCGTRPPFPVRPYPNQQPLTANLKGNGTGTVDLGNGYKMQLNEKHSEITIIDPKGNKTRIWGDPHVDVNGKRIGDFYDTTTFELKNGTKITINTEPWKGNKNAYVASQVVISKGRYGMVIDGISQNKHGDLSVRAGLNGYRLDAAYRDGLNLHESYRGGYGWNSELTGQKATKADFDLTKHANRDKLEAAEARNRYQSMPPWCNPWSLFGGFGGVLGGLEPYQAPVKDINTDGKWLASHGGYKKNADGSYTITKGEYANHTARWDGASKSFLIYDDCDCLVGRWKSKNGAEKIASPIAFDMNGDGKISTTGQTTAKDGLRTELGRTVAFDIDGDGTKENIEWLAGNGDAMLVDNRDGQAATDMSGKRLFGDQGGAYTDGYQKLSRLDTDGDGILKGAELNGLDLWFDDGDAIVEAGEMKSATSQGVTSVSVQRHDVVDENGETLMRSNATIDGKTVMTEDVWFGRKG